MTGVEKSDRIRLPYPHQGQILVRKEAKRFNWLSAGRRWRKTTLAMAIAVENAVKGKTIIWGAPTYDQVSVGFEETRKAAHSVVKFNQSRMEAHFPNGGRILYRSLDNPDNARCQPCYQTHHTYSLSGKTAAYHSCVLWLSSASGSAPRRMQGLP